MTARHTFSMDYVEGGNLTRLIRENPLPAKRAVGYVKTIAEAIHYAHEQGILHRDLKPPNVLIDHANQPRVTDFGLAKRMTKESFLTVTGQALGSPGFMPPEQAGAKAKAGRCSDVYGLGAILFYLVTGRPPFVAESVAETLHHVLNTEAVSPRLLNPSVPPDIATICLKCLEKEPAKRYQTAQQLADELDRFLNDEPIHARPVSRVEKAWRWCRRKPAVAAAAAVTLLAAAATILAAHQLHRMEQRRVTEQKHAAMDNALLLTKSGNLDEAETAIAAAELADVPAGELRLLRGQLAFHRSDYREAIRNFEQAARLSPDSVAISAILLLAYDQVGEWTKSARMLESVAKVNPKTPEDYLFLGMAEARWDAVRGLATLNKAVQMRPSAIALLIRADARANLADDSREITHAEKATAEMDLVLDMLPGNPVVLSWSLMARLAVANAYGDAGQTRRRETAMAQAAVANEALKHYPHSQDAVLARIWYLKYVDDQAGLLNVLRRADPAMSFVNYAYAAELCGRGEFEEALRVTERGAWTNAATADYCRGYVLAELPDGPARAFQEFQRFWGAHPPALAALNVQATLRLLGRRDEAVSACRSLRQRFSLSPPWRNGWYQRILDYNCDLITADELLRAAGKSRWNQCEAHFHIAMNLLAGGRRDAARDHFRQAVAFRIVHFYEDKWSRAFLARMERDPNWPPWISQKSEQ